MEDLIFKLRKKITKNNILLIVTFCMLFFIQFILILANYLTKYRITFSVNSINLTTPIYICIPFLLGIYIYDLFKNKRKFDIYDYIFIGLIFSGIISSLFAVNSKISFLGSEHRHEGFISILSYYLLFINWKVNGTEKDIKCVVKMIIFVGVLNAIYGLLQVYTNFDFILRLLGSQKTALGLCGNPNFFGSLIVTCLGFMTYYLLTQKITIKNIILYIIFLISLVNSQSTGPILTFIVVSIFLVVFLLIKKYLPLKKFLIIASLVTLIPVLFIMTYKINEKYFDNDYCELCNLKWTFITGGTGRIEIWKNTIEVVKDNWLVGVGYDNLQLVYPGNETRFRKVDNAHNVYLHTLVTTGILGFIPYMLLLLLTFIKALKSKNKYMLLLFSGFLAYSIQAFFNLSVIQIAPLYYVIIGLMLSIKEKKKSLV